MSDPKDFDTVAFNLYACLVCAIEHAEGREPELTPAWIENAKKACRDQELRSGANGFIYPEVKK